MNAAKRRTERGRKGEERRLLCVLVVLFAMALRVVYVPAHLAHEEHVGSVEYMLHHGVADETGATDHDHDHDEDHPPHSVLDHTSVLIVKRAPSLLRAVDCPALTPATTGSFTPPTPSGTCVQVDPPPPAQRSGRMDPARGPPAAA